MESPKILAGEEIDFVVGFHLTPRRFLLLAANDPDASFSASIDGRPMREQVREWEGEVRHVYVVEEVKEPDDGDLWYRFVPADTEGAEPATVLQY